MSGLVVFITAAFLLNGVFCSPAQEIDVDTILEILQTQSDLFQRRGDPTSSSSSSDSSDDDSSQTLRNRELANLVQEVSKRDRRKLRLDRLDDDAYRYKYNNDRDGQNQYKKYSVLEAGPNRYEVRNQGNKKSLENLLEELISQKLDKKTLTKERKDKLLPSTLLDSLHGYRNDDYSGNLNKYSKIFVVLNPSALETSKNKNRLADLVSQLVSASTLNEDRSLQRKNEKYRGLSVQGNSLSRRFRPDSKEMYAQKDSGEDDFKNPKRYRNDRGGGGGGTGGRTAIPYIRHRGDIYERS